MALQECFVSLLLILALQILLCFQFSASSGGSDAFCPADVTLCENSTVCIRILLENSTILTSL